jgi:hypothetical protein
MIALIGMVEVLLWGAISRTPNEELRAVFIIAFGIGSMWLLLLLGSLYAIIKVAHQSTDSNKAPLTKENPVST